MKLILCIVLVIVASLVATSLDAVPDPPAVNPHGLDFKIASVREVPHTFEEQGLRCAWLCVAPQFPLLQVGVTEIVRPNRPSDEMAAMACAADPSPPSSPDSLA